MLGLSPPKFILIVLQTKSVALYTSQRIWRVSRLVVCAEVAGNYAKNYKAWKLIQDSGCKNYQLGRAQLSKIHSNFIINKGNATSNDIEKLGEQIIQKVYEKFGIKLVWEIKIIGRKGIC